MATHFAVCERVYPGCSRQQDDTYVNVVTAARVTSATWESLLVHPTWGDPLSNEFVVQLTEQEFLALEDHEAIFHDGAENLPKWQQQTAGTGETKAFGSFATPTSAGSAFTLGVQVPDDRLIVRLYNGDPGAGGVHIAAEDLDQELVTGFVTRHLKLFTAADVASTTNAQNQKTLIGGRQMIFDFTNGVSTVMVSTLQSGVIEFPSNHAYRIVGPVGQKSCVWTVYGRTLSVG